MNDLRAIVAASKSCRVVGSAHSFSRIVATTGALISLADLPTRIEIDAASSTVTVSGATLYGELAIALHAAGFALHNLASLPHISVAGACATGTHGSGIGNGPLSSSVAAVELVTTSGDLVRLAHGDQDFPGAVVSLGALGALTALTLRIEPTYEIAQHVFTDLPVHVAVTQLCEILALGYSVSLFTSWGGDVVDQVWVKRRVDAGPIDVALLLKGRGLILMACTGSPSVVAWRKYSDNEPDSNHPGPNASMSTGGNWSKCVDAAIVPPRRPRRRAVSSSWMLPRS